MDHLPVMGKPDDLSDLPDQVESPVNAQPFSVLDQEMVEPHAERVVFEDERRPDFVLGESVARRIPG